MHHGNNRGSKIRKLNKNTEKFINLSEIGREIYKFCGNKGEIMVSRQLVYGHSVYDTSSTDISSTDISSTMTFLAELEAGVMKRILYQ